MKKNLTHFQLGTLSQFQGRVDSIWCFFQKSQRRVLIGSPLHVGPGFNFTPFADAHPKVYIFGVHLQPSENFFTK